eukprot:1171016-Prymnesium_polylepis.1
MARVCPRTVRMLGNHVDLHSYLRRPPPGFRGQAGRRALPARGRIFLCPASHAAQRVAFRALRLRRAIRWRADARRGQPRPIVRHCGHSAVDRLERFSHRRGQLQAAPLCRALGRGPRG